MDSFSYFAPQDRIGNIASDKLSIFSVRWFLFGEYAVSFIPYTAVHHIRPSLSPPRPLYRVSGQFSSYIQVHERYTDVTYLPSLHFVSPIWSTIMPDYFFTFDSFSYCLRCTHCRSVFFKRRQIFISTPPESTSKRKPNGNIFYYVELIITARKKMRTFKLYYFWVTAVLR